MASQPSIVMETFGVRDLRIEWKDAERSGAQTDSKIDIGYTLDQMPDRDVVRIGMTFSDLAKGPEGKESYTLSVHIMGFFRLAQGLVEEDRVKLLLGNGLAMLYSSLRGVLLPVSGCFPPGFRYILPTVNLQDVVREVESQREKAKPVKEHLKRRPPTQIRPSEKSGQSKKRA